MYKINKSLGGRRAQKGTARALESIYLHENSDSITYELGDFGQGTKTSVPQIPYLKKRKDTTC